jgi:hypothetical protein
MGSGLGGLGSGLGGKGMGGMGGSPGSGLGGAMRAPVTPLTSAGLTSPASSTPSVPRVASGGAPMGGGGQNLVPEFISSEEGAAAGAASAPHVGGGAMPPPTAPQYAPQPLAPFSGPQQPAVAVPASGGAPGAVTPAGPWAPGPAGTAGPVDAGHASGGPAGTMGAPMMGGGGMAAPISSGGSGGPTEPYSMPGAGGTTTPTTSIASSGPSPSQSSAAPPSGGAPLIATGGGGAAGAASAASVEEPDHHLRQAIAILSALVRQTADSGLQVHPCWAVAIADVVGGTYAIVASSAGDGGYIPPGVVLPTTARLAIYDPSLPRGWAGDRFLGWQHPADVIEAYCTEIRDRVYRFDIRATASNDPSPRRPRCGGSWMPVDTLSILRRQAEPVNPHDGQHQHRLKATDELLWSRLQTLVDSAKPELREQRQRSLAVAITDAVMCAAAESHNSLPPLALPSDEKLWGAVKSGAVIDETWRTWLAESNTTRELPETYQPLDLDDSAVAQNARLFYGHHYRSARLAELLTHWYAPTVSLADIAYCGLAGGFGQQMAEALARAERGAVR